jgi:uncharacterized protein YraI
MRHAVPALAAIFLLALSLPAEAAPTARTSGVQTLRDAPRSNAAPIIRLARNTRVDVIRCTRRSRWCLVAPIDGGPQGWMLGSYLIGSAAKNAVTPHEFVNPFWLFPNR